MAFKSGLKYSTKDSAVFLDGDLQDPPELIKIFIMWVNGYDVVYGIGVKRSELLQKFFINFLQNFFLFK